MKKYVILITLLILILTLMKPVFSYEDYIFEKEIKTPDISFNYKNGIVNEIISKTKTEPPFSLPFINIKIPIAPYLEFRNFNIEKTKYKYLVMDLVKKFDSISSSPIEYVLPENNVEFIGIFKKRGEKFILFRYYPIIYDEDKKEGRWLINFNLKVFFKKRTYSLGKRSKIDETPTYLIIGKKNIKDDIEFFINYKKSEGFNVLFKPIEDFKNEDIRDNIREYLKENYESMNIKYLLLIGTTDEIPMFEVFPNPKERDSPVETDFFYGELDSNIDFDGDNFPGEPEEDKIDFYSEIGVGRIPEDDMDTIVEILNRTITFENLKEKLNVLLAGGFWNFKEISTFGEIPETDGAYSLKVIFDKTFKDKGFLGTFLSEKEGIVKSTVEGEPLTYENFIESVNEVHPAVILWQGHGLSEATFRKVWVEDKNEDGYFQKDEGKLVRFVDINSPNTFNRDFPSITFMGACKNMFGVEESLAHIFLKLYSVSVIGSTETAWYGLGWKNLDHGWFQSIMYKFSENLSNLIDVSNSLNYAKEYYFENLIFPLQKYERYQNIYVFNILGDPSISLKVPEETISIVSNKVDTEEGKLFKLKFSSTKDISSIKGYIEYDPDIIKFFRFESKATFSFKEFTTGKIIFSIKDIEDKNFFTLLFFAKRSGETDVKLVNIIIDDEIEVEEAKSEIINIMKRKYPIWDINLDGVVDGEDLIEFSNHFGFYYPDKNYLDVIDFTMDGVIDGEDLIEFSNHFGETYKGG